MGADTLLKQMKSDYPLMRWQERIHFGGLLDVPDQMGETRAQGPVLGLALELFSQESLEAERLNLHASLVRGVMPEEDNDVLISEAFAQKLKVDPGDTVTFIGSTMNGAMTYYNFRVTGTVSFGAVALDRGTMIADIAAARVALDMEDAVGEIVGFLPGGFYSRREALALQADFNRLFAATPDEFASVMLTFDEQRNMKSFVDLANSMGAIITAIFMLAMSLVLWNAGLLGGLRRYGEVGVRLAMGEEKRHVFASMLYESVMIGMVGSVAGTLLGLLFAWLLQTYGLDISNTMKGASVMMPTVIRARITAADYYIGFFPGVISTLIGTALAGVGIFKRQTANLFKELDA